MFTVYRDRDPDFSEEMIGAFQDNHWGTTNLKWYDDGIGSLFVFGNEFGSVGVIRAESWESAYEIMLDEFGTEADEDELPEIFAALDTGEPYDDFVPTSSGKIVYNSPYDWMRPIAETDCGAIFTVNFD